MSLHRITLRARGGTLAAAVAVLVVAAPAGATTSERYDREGYISALTPITGDETPAKVDLYLTFAFGSAALTGDARNQLDVLAEAILSDGLQRARFGLYGHTDAVGSAAYNEDLSARRARAVRDYLVGQGVTPDRLDSRGFGETRPKNLLDPEAAENRRVEVVNLTPPPAPAGSMTPITGD